MTTIVKFGDLPKSLRDNIIRDTSRGMANISINRKTQQQEPQRSNIEIIPEFITAAQAGINSQFGSDIQPGFTGSNSIEFYTNVLNAIDNMILLDFIRDNQSIATSTDQNYTATQTTDVTLDMALVYYSIKYPLDTTVDSAKLYNIRLELADLDPEI